jgi:hypothetical protein
MATLVDVAPKPLPIRVLNSAYRLARKAGLNPGELTKQKLMARASRQAGGLVDFGDPRFEEGLDELIESIETEDRLNGMGRVLAHQHLTNLLKQRLLMTGYLKAHPEILDERIERPLFIIGAPRTGTTITHHLLSQDDRFRYPFTWECDEIHPPLDPATMHSDPRIARSQKGVDRALRLAPNLDAAHPMGALEAQECALLHAYDFASETFNVMFNCQGYGQWLAQQDRTWVYAQQKVMLQYMQSGGLRPRESWLLKTPPHMEQIDKILEVFPDARFVTTYREPTEIIASSCSLSSAVIAMAQDDVDWHLHGRNTAWGVSMMLARNVDLREQLRDRADQFIDFSMERMVREPLTCISEIYSKFGIELTDAVRQQMEGFMTQRTDRKPHVYDPADYGLDIPALWPKVQFYRDFYNIEGNQE